MDVRMFVNSNVRNAYIWVLGDMLQDDRKKKELIK
jgi:hypothetical protein